MRHLFDYSKFIFDRYNYDQTDRLEISSQKKSANQIEEYIKEYGVKKVTLDNIYLTYVDDKDLINKLKTQKFISGNPSNQKTIEFINPLLGIHAQISQNLRKIKGIEAEIKSDEESKSSKQKISDGSPEAKDAMTNDIKSITDKIASKKADIIKINNDVLTLKKSIDIQLASMKKELMSSQRRISTDQMNKLSEK